MPLHKLRRGVGARWVLVSSTFTNQSNNNGDTSSIISLPSGILAGDLLVAFVAHHVRRTSSWPAGWTEIADDFASGTLGDGAASIGWRLADGATDGTTVTVTSSDKTYSSGAVVQIRGADTTTPILELPAKAYSTGTTSHDPPAVSPSWGTAGHTFFINAALGTFASGTSGTVDDVTSCTPGVGYNNLGYGYNDTGTGDQRTVAALAYKVAISSIEDPAAWTILDDNMDIQSYTIAVQPK